MYLPESPTYSLIFVRNAITSCFTSFSISLILDSSNFAFKRISFKAASGIFPREQFASHAAISTLSQLWNFAFSVQILPISGNV